MRQLVRFALLAGTVSLLAGCYYDPGYNYVRPTDESGQGDVYYGTPEPAPVYDTGYGPAGYYGPDYGDYGYYGGGFGVSTIWVDDGHGHRYRREVPRGDGRGHDFNHDHDHDGDHRPGGDGRPHDWNGRDHGSAGGRPPDGGHRPPPPGGWQHSGGGPRPGGNGGPRGGSPNGHPSSSGHPAASHGGDHADHDDHHHCRQSHAPGLMTWRGLAMIVALLLLSGCGSLRYYAHVGKGQARVLLHRRAIDTVIADPHTDPTLARRLALALAARRFASATLALPDNRSYTTYVDLQRPFVAWNVFATPTYSLAPVTHCFPFAGCVAYRGYFAEDKAQAESARLRAEGKDVSVGGVPAYSTLGWFADPVLSSMLRWDDDELSGTIFHELAHQRVYVKDDTAFNESYATFVQRQGLLAWRQSRGLGPADDRDERMERGFVTQVIALRTRLTERYAQGGDTQALARAKREEFDAFRQRYAQWRDVEWKGDRRYDAWVDGDINNASLLPFGLYEQWVPAFATLFAQCEGAWPLFFQRVAALATLPAATREARLRALMPAGTAARSESLPQRNAG
jgi:predicted aminopeptidase